MKKIFLIFLILFVLASVVFFVLFFDKNKTTSEISLQKAELSKGVVKVISEDYFELEIKINGDGLSEEVEKKEKLIFYINESTEFRRLIDSVKDESTFRKEELSYNDWKKKYNQENSILDYKFAPSWYKTEKSSLDNLSVGDKVEVIYYQESAKKFAIKVLVERGNDSSDNLVKNSEVFNARVEVADIKSDSLVFSKPDNFTFSDSDTIEAFVVDNTEIIQKTTKSKMQFRREEAEYKEERLNLKSLGKDISNLEAPSWFLEEAIDLDAISLGDIINISVYVEGDSIFIKKIEKNIN